MSNPTQANYVDLLRATDGVRNWRAQLFILGSIICAALLSALGGATHSPIVIGLMAIVAALVVAFGINAAGTLLMDQANTLPPRPMIDALFAGTTSFLRIFVIALLMLAGLLAFALIAGLIFFVCKIPGVGPALYTVALPVTVVAGAALFLGLFVTASLMAPAVWQGNGIGGAISRLVTIVRERLLDVIIRLILLGILLSVTFGIVAGVLFLSGASTIALSTAILGYGAGADPGDMMSMMMLFGGGGGHAVAASIGLGVLAAIVWSAMLCCQLLGACLVYLRASDGLDFAAADKMVADRIADAKRRANEVQERARQRAEAMQARQQDAAASATMPVPPTPPTPPMPVKTVSADGPPPRCPACHKLVADSDLFCGECGQRLR